MCVALLLLPRPARLPCDELTPHECAEHLIDLLEARESPQALAALLQLPGGLGAAQHQHREEGDLRFAEPERFVEQVPELDRAARRTARKPRPAPANETVERPPDRWVVVVRDGVALGGLVAREPQRVQRERVGVRRRPLLLDQAAENAKLDGVGVHHVTLMSATRTAKVADGRSVPPERVTAAFAVSAAAAALLAAHGRADVGTPPGLSVSSNWSGYVATGPAFSGVSGSWTVPSTNCFGQAPQHTAASFWVGLGGALPTSHKIEQIGTAAGCNTDGSANYYAWYELWPRRAVGLSLDIEPGDRMHASVRLRSGGVELALADLTSGRRFVHHLTLVKPDASSAEWIGEAPMLVV